MKWVLNVRNGELETPGLWVMDLESRKAMDGECLEGHKLQEDLGVSTCAPAWMHFGYGFMLSVNAQNPREVSESRMDCWNIRSEKGREDQSHISLEFGTVLEPISGGLSRS